MRTKAQAKPSATELAFSEYLTRIGVTMTCRHLGQRKDADDWEHDLWFVTLQRPGKADVTTEYRTGMGHRVADRSTPDFVRINPRSLATEQWVRDHAKPHAPQAAGVLHCLLMDASSAEQNFYDWCDELGYNNDSLKARNTYDACCQILTKLRGFFTGTEHAAMTELLEDY